MAQEDDDARLKMVWEVGLKMSTVSCRIGNSSSPDT